MIYFAVDCLAARHLDYIVSVLLDLFSANDCILKGCLLIYREVIQDIYLHLKHRRILDCLVSQAVVNYLFRVIIVFYIGSLSINCSFRWWHFGSLERSSLNKFNVGVIVAEVFIVWVLVTTRRLNVFYFSATASLRLLWFNHKFGILGHIVFTSFHLERRTSIRCYFEYVSLLRNVCAGSFVIKASHQRQLIAIIELLLLNLFQLRRPKQHFHIVFIIWFLFIFLGPVWVKWILCPVWVKWILKKDIVTRVYFTGRHFLIRPTMSSTVAIWLRYVGEVQIQADYWWPAHRLVTIWREYRRPIENLIQRHQWLIHIVIFGFKTWMNTGHISLIILSFLW